MSPAAVVRGQRLLGRRVHRLGARRDGRPQGVEDERVVVDVAEELVLEHLVDAVGAVALLGFDAQAPRAEVREDGVDALGEDRRGAEPRRALHVAAPRVVVHVAEHELIHRAARLKGVEADEELVDRGAEAEPVRAHVVAHAHPRALVVLLRRHHLRAHVPERAGDAVKLVRRHVELGEPEVAELRPARRVEDDVRGLEVPVHVPGAVQEVQA
mmetsp:Transcript_44299/g.139132  ORF Transcript_44299/g.139132 Transcript_44299/m.139132 type:complete len:213 (-) Transcript_44299:1665-2303(-)